LSTRLQGKIAVVTGSGNGIGRAIAQRFAREGAAVVVADLDTTAASAVADEINKEGHRALPCHVDIRKPEQIEAMFAFTREKFGVLDILINNAGIGGQRHFLDTPLEMLRNMIEVNVIGTYLCAQHAAHEMVPLKRGRIVNFSSHSGLLGSTGRSAYAASKGGVIAMTRGMAVDLAEHNILVNAIAPGPIDVPRSRAQHTAERRTNWERAVPLARYGEPPEVAALALFLASDEASYITGQTLTVDGGFTAAGLRVTQL